MTRRPVLVLGSGGHAKVVIECLRRGGWQIQGIVSPELPKGSAYSGYPVLGSDKEILEEQDPTACEVVNGVGSIGSQLRRRELFERYRSRGFYFPAIIHPAAVVPDETAIGDGTQIMAGVIIQPGVSIGENSLLNTRCCVDHDCVVGSHVHLAPGVTISGNVRIGNGVHVGTGATIIQGLNLASGCLVGAGAVVVRNVEAQRMVFGVPARVIRTIKDWRRVLISPETTMQEAIRVIDDEALRIALVVDGEQKLLGSLTDGDIRRAMLKGMDLAQPVAKAMNSTPLVAKKGDPGEKLLRLMLDHAIQHLPVLDDQGRILRLELIENFLARSTSA